MSDVIDMAEAARYYASRGWVPVPVKGKVPVGERWQQRTIADVRPEEFPGYNLGVLLGAPSGNLTDVDLDCSEATIAARYLLLPTPAVFGRPGNPGSHGEYVTDAEPKTIQYKDTTVKDGGTLVELRGTGAQTVYPPSTHVSGESISWIHYPPEPATVKLADLQFSVAEVAAAALLARHHPGDGSRHEFGLALAGMLSHGGYPQQRAERLVEAVSDAAGDRDHRDRVKCVIDTYARRNGHNTTGAPTLARMVGDAVVTVVRGWLSLQQGVVEVAWDDPVKIGDERSPVPIFPAQLLPDAVRDWICDIAERTQAPIEYPASSCLVTLGAAIGRRCGIRPKRHDDWTVVPNLYGAVIGPPGAMKSAPVREAQKPLMRLEIQAAEDFKELMKNHNFSVIVGEQRKRIISERVKAAIKAGQNPAELQAELGDIPEPPTCRRFVLNDATVEKLGEILNENPCGVLVVRDELAGLLRLMDREGHENDRGFYLEAWNGDGAYTYDRIGRGTLRIEAACLSIFGTIQPGPVLELIRTARRNGADADGFLQRFQVLVWPDVSKEWRNVDRWPDSRARTFAFETFRRLVNLALTPEDGGIPFLRFTPDAQAFFDDWRTELERKLRSGEDSLLEGHLSKYRSLFPSLALILHLADWGMRPTMDAPAPVGIGAAERAACLCEVFEAHARRLYLAALAETEEAAVALLKKVQSGALPNGFTARDVYRNQWVGLTDPEMVGHALTLLEEMGWIRAGTESTGGRRRVTYAVNPAARVSA